MSLPIRGARLLSRLNYGKPTVGFDLFNRHVVEDGADDPITGFHQANQLTLQAVASLVPETGTGEITITVEGYDPDLDSWDPIAEFTPLDANGSETITPEAGWPDQLRATYAITGDAQWRARVLCRATASFTVNQIEDGGSQTVKVVDLGVIDIAAVLAGGPVTLHTMGAGEFLAGIRYTDTDYEDIDNLPLTFGIGTEKSFGWGAFAFIGGNQADPRQAGSFDFWDTLSLQAYSWNYDPRSATDGVNSSQNGAMILSVSPIIQAAANYRPANPADGGGTRVDAIATWQALTAYDDGANTVATAGALRSLAVIGNGTVWVNSGDAGTSGAMSPDFAGNSGGTVADGADIVWTDTTKALPTTGKVHAVAEIWTPA